MGNSSSSSLPPTLPPMGSSSSTPTARPSGPPRSSLQAPAGSLTQRFARKYDFIPDSFSTLDQVQDALRSAGLESSNLIVGIDFTKSNEWSGKRTFGGKSLHAISSVPNPYEQAISIIGRTLSSFDDDQLIPCFGFGDVTTHDQYSFHFYNGGRPCNGFNEALYRYRQIAPHVRLAGPTSFAPIVEAAVRIVEQSGGMYHVLLIIADGQVTRSSDMAPGVLSPQEKATVDAITAASNYALSIVLVGVGDGPWDAMLHFDNLLRGRNFDNFQFVDFSSIMLRQMSEEKKEAQFALAALMEIPEQFKACQELGYIGRRAGRLPPREALPLPPSVMAAVGDQSFPSAPPPPTAPPMQEDARLCPICISNVKNMAFQCGHQTCVDCGKSLSICPICRSPITARIKLYG